MAAAAHQRESGQQITRAFLKLYRVDAKLEQRKTAENERLTSQTSQLSCK
jgi:hypothetical protein